ncbi:MAG TPA: folate-binding protein [Stellaceae bacterium]|nr:folate-binding protein [Stellaceae bacterium]
MPDASFVLLDDRGVLAVGGPDRRQFLQGLISNDVDKVGADRARYAALLTAQGKYLHDFTMVECALGADAAILLDAEAGRLADLKRRLSLYRLRAKVSLDARPDLAVAAVFGDGAIATFGLVDQPGAARPFAAGIAFVDPRLAALGARCILPRSDAPAALTRAGLHEADFAAWDAHRLGLGIPDGGRDLELEKSILLEAGFDELNGIDWQKGCYIGQELTARTKYRGLVKRRLVPVVIDGPVPPVGTPISNLGREVGELRSSRDGHGLALLRIEALRGNQKLTAGDAAIVPFRPDWLQLPADDGG